LYPALSPAEPAVAAAAGDGGMQQLMTNGEPGYSGRALADLVVRIPAINRALA
jgi:hypothetical protein